MRVRGERSGKQERDEGKQMTKEEGRSETGQEQGDREVDKQR